MTAKTFPPLKNDLILRAARGEPVERVPVWVMRQAGRYLPEFQEIRKKHEFFEVCKTPELACEVTLQPIRRFDLDAAIIFSDILVVPEAMGLEVQMLPGKGPSFPQPLDTPDDMKRLKPDTDVYVTLKYVFDAITLTRTKLEGKCPLLGFSGAPWTLMAYMIEGGGSTTYSKSKKWLYNHASQSHELLMWVTKVVIKYLIGQVEAGAQMLQIFDSHAGILGPDLFSIFGIPYLKMISQGVKEGLKEKGINQVPMTIFAKDAHFALKDLSKIGYDVLGLDWTISPKRAREETHCCITLQGNLDPCALYADEAQLTQLVERMVKEFGTRGYIANLGHGIYPDTPLSGMQSFVELVHKHTEELCKQTVQEKNDVKCGDH
ncbi:hypothetical protein HELRODRAFT_191893 [Helobdella robusta]|uniref:Uroporphyrinogen decarboxylase n=1 Tax=Helobdella robusta TaxID=6412 RepID=T1FTE4_HELRO|nr:hypothetical protein HELRODRAFT_191893 [Helobdella robusta]ESO03622.1 hypothetical protein HELRODRAFT_191893 [Helobdella robusta]